MRKGLKRLERREQKRNRAGQLSMSRGSSSGLSTGTAAVRTRFSADAAALLACGAAVGVTTSSERHMYHAATEQYGCQFFAIFCIRFGEGRSRIRYAFFMAARTP